MSVNKAIIIGNLGSDPEVRYTQSGQAVANFNIATTDTFNDKAGNRQERTEWHRIVVWGRQAEICKQYLSKGRQVYVEGRLQTREWTDQSNQTRRTTEINAQTVRFLGGGRDAGAGVDHGGGFSTAPSTELSPPQQQTGPPQEQQMAPPPQAAPPVQQAAPQQAAPQQAAPQQAAPQQAAPQQQGGGGFVDDDIPF